MTELWDEAKTTLSYSQRYGDGLPWRFIGAGMLVGDQQSPADGDRGLVDDVFSALGNELRAAADVVPIELLAALVCTEAEVNGRVIPPVSRDLAGFVDAETTPHLRLVGCAALRLDLAEAIGLTEEQMADPETALVATASHIIGSFHETHFSPPMVAAAYNVGAVRFDNDSPFRMASFDGDATRISRFCIWFSTVTTLCLGNSSLYTDAVSFAASLLTMAPPPVPSVPTAVTSVYRRPESQAAIDGGMMTVWGSNAGLNTVWSMDQGTLSEIKGVANDVASGMGLPGGMPVFAYPDRAGVPRIMTANEVQSLYMAMRDFIMAVRMFDVGQLSSLPGQPVFIP